MKEEGQDHQANRLVKSSSPYLLQHAYNPVDWYPWGEEAFSKAREANKPIILSIGYSSCHWCHVMERESFENDNIAEVMNQYFVSVKVDREERPDVDQIYMDAVQAMGMNGGWPLNVFLTPDLKPFYGGTYFPPQQWLQILSRIAKVYETKHNEVIESAEQLTTALATSEVHKYNLALSESTFDEKILNEAYAKLSSKFDRREGGVDKAPKFPMPTIWLYLLRYHNMTNDQEAMDQLKLTLNKMALGGIYDQAGGGFSRYSTDKEWLVPHFEKMLYDNGQLVSLYSEAYKISGDALYKHVVYQTTEWLEREMMHENYGFFSALDADSEDEEGKYYVFTKEEIEKLLPKKLASLAVDFYNINEKGNWEHEKNILHSKYTPEEYARINNIDITELKQDLQQILETLRKEREKRVAPGLDNKILASWNALMNVGLTDAYRAFGDEKFLKLARQNMDFMLNNMIYDGILQRTYKVDGSHLDAYLEDYAAFIKALINLYKVTFDQYYLDQAKKHTNLVIDKFYDPNENMFFYTSGESTELIARKKEIFDNVIPSSNSIMATNLYLLSLYFDEENYKGIAEKMLRRVSDLISNEPIYLSNWAILYYYMNQPTAEVVIVGDNFKDFQKQLFSRYHPNAIFMGSKNEGTLPLMKNRAAKNGETTIYVCFNKTCKLPVTDVSKALELMVKK